MSSTSTTGFCVDSIKVIEGGATSTPLPQFEKMEGASGITVVVPMGRPHKQTGRFLFTPKPATTETTDVVVVSGGEVGGKRPREEVAVPEYEYHPTYKEMGILPLLLA